MLGETPENNKMEEDQEGSDTYLGYDSDGKVSPLFDAIASEMDIKEWDEDGDVQQDAPDKNLLQQPKPRLNLKLQSSWKVM